MARNIYMVFIGTVYCNITKDDQIKPPWCNLFSHGFVEDRVDLQYYIRSPCYI